MIFISPWTGAAPTGPNIPARIWDFARLRAQVLAPLLAGQEAAYRAYACRRGELLPAVALPPRPLTIVEGSYALHPALDVPYACRVFLTCAPACQRARLQKREGGRYPAFAQRWIPLEEGYLAAEHPERGCDIVLDTTGAAVV